MYAKLLYALYFILGLAIAFLICALRDRFLIFRVKRPSSLKEATDIATDLIGNKMCELIAYAKCVGRVTKLRPSGLISSLADTLKEIASEEAALEAADYEQQ